MDDLIKLLEKRGVVNRIRYRCPHPVSVPTELHQHYRVLIYVKSIGAKFR